MPRRRDFLLAMLAAGWLPALARATGQASDALPWTSFIAGMRTLAAGHADDSLSSAEIGERGLALLGRLDTGDAAFHAALAESYESGNRFWLWQRLSREPGISGGILVIEQGHDVPLHDHPGATGMLRVLSGELELWQFDRPAQDAAAQLAGRAHLQRVSHRVLRPGDTALLSPRGGNIHALRARTRECSMLDYFIPPYVRRARTWFEPESDDWRSLVTVACRCIGEADFSTS